MATILKSKSIYYNDCNLIATKPTAVHSRSDIPKEMYRIIVSPMSAVVGETFTKEALSLGLTVCLHKFCAPEEEARLFGSLSNTKNCYVSVGLDDISRVKLLVDKGATNWLIDVANGYMPSISDTILKYVTAFGKDKFEKIVIGNIHSKEGISMYHWVFNTLPNIREFSIRVGIAGGSACSTADSTGYNRGQITEIMECSEIADGGGIRVIADGGVKNGNYAMKAFSAGADYCMLGGYFSKAKEAQTHIIGDHTYWGGASHKQQELYGGVRRHSEGKVIAIHEELKPLKELVNDLWGGISSGVSYSGYKTLTEAIGNGTFEVKENSLAPSKR